jgi:hypothetical protein
MAAMAPGAMPTKDEEAIKVSKTVNLIKTKHLLEIKKKCK